VDGPGPAIDESVWGYETRRFRAVGFDFSIALNDPDLGRFLDEAWAPMAVPGTAAHRYAILDRGPGAHRRFSLHFDGDRYTETNRPSNALRMLCWHVNGQVVAHRGDHLLLHAAAAEHDGRALLIPATMESGKTTLVAGLTRAGLRYLTDEAVAVDPSANLVHPYAKPLSVDPGSWEVLAALRPDVPQTLEPYLATQWQVPALSIRADAVGRPCPPAWLVTTSYQSGARTALTPLSPSEAVIAVARNTFHFDQDARRHLATIGALVARCQRYRLVVSDLDRACELVLDLVGKET
jgi:hypothetical protein